MTDLDRLWPFELRQGNSDDPRNGACTMDAVSWFAYGRLGDHPECASPALTSFVIFGQDAMPHTTRQWLKPYIFRLIDSRDPAAEAARTRCLVLASVRCFAPLALDAVHLYEQAARLRALPDTATYAEIRIAAAAARGAAEATRAEAAWAAKARAAAARAARAEAAWAAAEAAWTAAEAAEARAEAAAARAAWAARAARAEAAAAARAAAEAARAASGAVWDAYFETLDEALSLGKQGSLDIDLDHVAARVNAFAARQMRTTAYGLRVCPAVGSAS